MTHKHTETDLCHCGTQAQAAERAAQLIREMGESDECPVFILSVIAAMHQIGEELGAKTIANASRRGGGRNALMVTLAMIRGIEAVKETTLKGDYVQRALESFKM